ncbi:hypothetical protein RHOSPDRAFT_31917 [Rhodotorula sp. JG-1b]|nr:hypothetical protein RHOSPDRAFT_31917 [Rhodotorula sp. JG-1b]
MDGPQTAGPSTSPSTPLSNQRPAATPSLRLREPPPASWKLARPRTTSARSGASVGFTYEDEVGSYRRLEWLGDSVLHSIYGTRLFKLFPKVGSGFLSPKPGFRPLRQVQNVVADLFEAHLGALAEEGRETEIAEWVETLLARNRDRLERRAGELLAQAHETVSQSRSEVRKRAREDAFTGGCEIDERTKRRRTSYLEGCPAPPSLEGRKPRYDDRSDGNGGWHSHLLLDDATVGCGTSRKLFDARTAAVEDFSRLLGTRKDLRPALDAFVEIAEWPEPPQISA